MQKLLWRNSEGEELDLTNHTEYGVTEWEGFAGTDLNIQSQQVPFQDGSVFLDALLSERELTVTLAMQDNNNLQKRYELRRELIHKLNPKLGEGVLIYQNDFIKKQIKCVPHIPIFETHNSDTVGTSKASLTWTANNPYWEDVEETTIKFMGTMRNQIEYDGDVETGVNLEYIGYSASLKIENVNDKKEIELQGIGTNRKIDISTKAGSKTIFATDLHKSTLYTGFPFYDVCVANDYLFFITSDLQGGYILSYMDTDGIIRESKTPALCGRFKYLEPVIYCESREEYYIYIPSTTKFYSSSDLETWTESQYLYKDVGDWVVRVDTSENWEISSDGETFTSSTMTDFMFVEDLGYYTIDNNNMYFGTELNNVSVIKHEDSPYRFYYLMQFGEYVVAQTNYGIAGANVIFKNNVEVTDNIFGEGQFLTRVVPFRNDLIGYLEGGQGYRLINKNFQTLNGLKYQDEAPKPLCTYEDKLYLLLGDEGDIFNIYGITENLTDYTVMDKNAFTYGQKVDDVYYFVDFAVTHGHNYLYMSGNLKNLEFVEELQLFGGYIKDDIISGFEWIDMNYTICLYKIENYQVSERIVTPILSYNNGHRKFGNKLYVFAENGLWESSDLENWTQSYNGENVLDLCITENNKIVLTDTKYYLNDVEQTAPAQFKKVEWSDYYQKFLFISDSECYSSMDGLNFEQVEGIEGNLVDILYDEKQSLWWILADTICYTYYMDLLSQIECSGISGSLCLTEDGVLIVNRQMQEIVYSRSTNLINKMTGVSNMSFGLKTGTNIVTFNGGDKDVLFLKYRRRYIGV